MLTTLPTPPADSRELDRTRSRTFVQDRITGIVVAAFFTVHRELGSGFANQVYRRALVIELQQRGLRLEQDLCIGVFYKGAKVGQYNADLVVENRVIVQVRGESTPAEWNGNQLARHLPRCGCSAALLLLFGPTPVFRHLTAVDGVVQERT